MPAPLIRNPRGTNWGSFREGLREKLERGPEMNMKDETGLGLAVHWVQQAYEDNCPLRPVKKGRKSLRWTSEIESLRTEVIRIFTKCWQTIIHIAGNSTERLIRDIERSYERLPKILGGLSDPPGQLGYKGLYLGTLKSDWDLWWLLLESTHNPKGKPWISCLLLTSPTQLLWRGEWYPLLPAMPNVWTGRWLRG
jgi:hypothetical protein